MTVVEKCLLSQTKSSGLCDVKITEKEIWETFLRIECQNQIKETTTINKGRGKENIDLSKHWQL